MTSFGGNFIQKPNPIDFDKVFTEFSRLSESGNISVLVTIACVFLTYFIVLVFARRADRKDERNVSIILEYESDPRNNGHFISGSENKAWQKFRPVLDLNP